MGVTDMSARVELYGSAPKCILHLLLFVGLFEWPWLQFIQRIL